MKKQLLSVLLFFLTSYFGYSKTFEDNRNLTCPTPTSLNISNVTFTSVALSWTENGTATSWHILALPCGSAAPTSTTTGWVSAATNPFTLTGLLPGTCYTFYIRSVCALDDFSFWSSSINVTTTFAPPSCGGNYLDSGQASANYSNNENSTVTICPVAPGDVVSVTFTSFDIESFNDALYVFNGPTNAGLQISSSNGAGNVPGGLAGGYWGTTIPGPFTSSTPDGCLTFRFRSNATITNSGWISNVTCGPPPCTIETPTNVTVSNVNPTSINVSWDEYIYSGYQILTLPHNSPEPTESSTGFINANYTPFVVSGLSPNTCYDIYIRSYCDTNEFSPWSEVSSICTFDCSYFATCTYSIIATAFLDSNGNGIKEATETNFNLGNFNYTVNGSTPLYSSSSDGVITIPVLNSTNIYNVNFSIQSVLSPYFTCTTSYSNVSVDTISGTTNLYFPVNTIAPYTNVYACLSSEPPRPGFLRTCVLYYGNNSTTTVPNGTITFTKNNLETITSISQSGTVSTANGFTFNYTNLTPNETRYIYITLQTPTIPTVNLGDLLTVTSSITPISNDIYPENNNHSVTQTVVGSYDPNEVYESHGPEIPINNFTSNDYLNYTITFENTGTANAEFIRIENLLNNKLNPSTIEMIGSSHNYDLKRENNKLTWFFYDIDLPPTSQNPILSHGFVSYRIKPNPSIAIGDIIPNTASIFFDYNPPIITNTFNTEFVAPLNNLDFNSGNFIVYPNPTNGLVQISLKNYSDTIQNVTIFDVLGKIVKKVEAVNSNQTNINVSELSSGIYMVEVATENNLKQVKKLVIK